MKGEAERSGLTSADELKKLFKKIRKQTAASCLLSRLICCWWWRCDGVGGGGGYTIRGI